VVVERNRQDRARFIEETFCVFTLSSFRGQLSRAIGNRLFESFLSLENVCLGALTDGVVDDRHSELDRAAICVTRRHRYELNVNGWLFTRYKMQFNRSLLRRTTAVAEVIGEGLRVRSGYEIAE